MEDSFVLLSSMSPKVKGRQKTLKVKRVSKLAVKQHFRRTSIYDNSCNIKNEDLEVIELSTETSESIASSNELKPKKPNENDVIIIDPTDSEEEDDIVYPSGNLPANNHLQAINKRIEHWLEDVKVPQKNDTFFSQVSTVYGDEAPAQGADKVAICSTLNEEVNHRFDELFVTKRKPPKSTLKDDSFSITDDSFSLGLDVSLSSKLKKSTASNKCASQTPTAPLKPVSKAPQTPSNLSINEAASLLDSLYGKEWRKNEQQVLLPLSEPRKKPTKVVIPTSEKPKMPHIKASLEPQKSKINFGRLKAAPMQSPWIKQLKGLVDSDTDSEGGVKKNDCVIQRVKTRLDFDEADSPVERTLSKGGGNKENRDPVKSNTKVSSKTDSDNDISSDEEYDKEVQLLEMTRRNVLPSNSSRSYSFLESLSATVPLSKCDFSARIFRTNFKQHREQLTRKLFDLFNEKIFENALPQDSALEWNVNLRKTAGRCHSKKVIHRDGTVERTVKINLSTKVLDSADRLRDTLVHEMCHAACWVVNHVSDGHGVYWKSWAFKAMKTFPELPAINRCHNYEINSKYTYKCTKCGYSFGRHTKSLDIERKRCGRCYGKFEVLLNKTGKNGEVKSIATSAKKEATGFALFVKENYAQHKDPAMKHGDIMKILGRKFAEMKVKGGGQ